jgi:hypothetical protein
MNKNNDPIPRKETEFSQWGERFTTNLQPSLERFGFPPATYELVVALKTAYINALKVASNPMTRNSGTIKDKNDARKVFEKETRAAIRRYLSYNPDVTNKDREDLGIPVHDTTHTPIPAPSTRPALEVEVSDIKQIRLHFHDYGSESKARPYGVNGAVILYAILPKEPTDISELTKNLLATRTPYTFEFAESERGKTIYFAACWQNAKGQRGHWSRIINTVIP